MTNLEKIPIVCFLFLIANKHQHEKLIENYTSLNFSLIETPGINFTNVLRAAFVRANPKREKKTVK